jgi:integrase
MASARNLSKTELIKLLNSLKSRYSEELKMLFILGIFTGFRIREILTFCVSDIVTTDGIIKNYITVKAKNMKRKTKARTILIPKEAQEKLADYCETYLRRNMSLKREGYFFPKIRNAKDMNGAYQRVYKAIKSAVGRSGINPRGISTHTMRKTWVKGFLDETDSLNPRDILKVAGQWENRDSMEHYIPKEDEQQEIDETQIKIGKAYKETINQIL